MYVLSKIFPSLYRSNSTKKKIYVNNVEREIFHCEIPCVNNVNLIFALPILRYIILEWLLCDKTRYLVNVVWTVRNDVYTLILIRINTSVCALFLIICFDTNLDGISQMSLTCWQVPDEAVLSGWLSHFYLMKWSIFYLKKLRSPSIQRDLSVLYQRPKRPLLKRNTQNEYGKLYETPLGNVNKWNDMEGIG